MVGFRITLTCCIGEVRNLEEIEETPKQEETPYQKHPQQKPYRDRGALRVGRPGEVEETPQQKPQAKTPLRNCPYIFRIYYKLMV